MRIARTSSRRVSVAAVWLAIVAAPWNTTSADDRPGSSAGPQFAAPQPLPSVPFAEPPPLAATEGLSLGDRCRPDYWIVSSHDCPQELCDCRVPNCGLKFYRMQGQRLRAAHDPGEFAASMHPDVPLLIVVHGSFVDPRDVKYDAARTFAWIRDALPGQPLHVAFYSWPSEWKRSLLPLWELDVLGRRAEFNGHYLARLVLSLPANQPVCLLGHSHGARLSSAAMHLLGGGAILGIRQPAAGCDARPLRAVFAAAAFEHRDHDPGERFGQALWRSEAALNLRNRLDVPLLMYPLRKPFGGEALATSGWTETDRRRLGWMSAKVRELDVSDLVGSGHMWPNYYGEPSIACAISPYVYFADRATRAAPAAAPLAVPEPAAATRPLVRTEAATTSAPSRRPVRGVELDGPDRTVKPTFAFDASR